MLKSLVLALIRLYQRSASWRRWIMPPMCRFYPTCSSYMAEAIETHGLFAGFSQGTMRLFRCHPWHPGGVDPVRAKAL